MYVCMCTLCIQYMSTILYYVCTRDVLLCICLTMYVLGLYILFMYICLYATMSMDLASSCGTNGRRENRAGQCVSVTPTATERFNHLVL